MNADKIIPELINLDIYNEDLSKFQRIYRTAKNLLTEKEKVEHVKNTYGLWFSNAIGLPLLVDLPVIDYKQLDLTNLSKYNEQRAKPEHMKGLSAGRGIISDQDIVGIRHRPFIAVLIEIKDKKTLRIIDEVVEVFFKRDVYDENNYVSSLTTYSKTDAAHYRQSVFHCGSGMNENDIKSVRELLEGKEIEAPRDKSLLIQMKKI